MVGPPEPSAADLYERLGIARDASASVRYRVWLYRLVSR
jgi:hypothetical protein